MIFNTISHMLTLLLYPYSTVAFLLGMFIPSSTIIFTSFTELRSEQSIPYYYLSDILFESHMLNSLIITLYGLDRCPDNTVSLKLESYEMNATNSLLWETLLTVLHLVIYKLLCLLLLLYKSDILNLIFRVARTYFISNHEQSQNPHPKINQMEMKEKIYHIEKDETLLCDDNVMINYNGRLKIEQRSLNIAWTNLTIKVTKSLFKSEKIILRDINGSVEFETMMALMGPSGAGKSTLLRALMGMNKKLIAKESKFYCNQSVDRKTCFIAQDVRQHIISGLTVKQSIIYASKLAITLKTPKILNPKITLKPPKFEPPNYFKNPKFLNPKILSPKFLNPKFLNPKFLNPKILYSKFLNPKILYSKFLNPKILYSKFLKSQITIKTPKN